MMCDIASIRFIPWRVTFLFLAASLLFCGLACKKTAAPARPAAPRMATAPAATMIAPEPATGPGGGECKFFIIRHYGVGSVVYVIPSSADMKESLEFVRFGMGKSLAALASDQVFAVVTYQSGADGKTAISKSFPAQDMAAGAPDNVNSAAKFVKQLQPAGKPAEPVGALAKAFAMLGSSRAAGGKLIVLVAHGPFEDSKAVRNAVARLNKDKPVMISLAIFGRDPNKIPKFMTDIASGNGGQFYFLRE